MNALTIFATALLDGFGLLVLLAAGLVVWNFRDCVAWVRNRWHQLIDLPPTTTVDRMVAEVRRREQGGAR